MFWWMKLNRTTALGENSMPVTLNAISLYSIVHVSADANDSMPFWGMFRMTRFLMVTLSTPLFRPRNAASSGFELVQPVPSRIAPYSPTKVLPVFGVIELIRECTPALRQNVVAPE